MKYDTRSTRKYENESENSNNNVNANAIKMDEITNTIIFYTNDP